MLLLHWNGDVISAHGFAKGRHEDRLHQSILNVRNEAKRSVLCVSWMLHVLFCFISPIFFSMIDREFILYFRKYKCLSGCFFFLVPLSLSFLLCLYRVALELSAWPPAVYFTHTCTHILVNMESESCLSCRWSRSTCMPRGSASSSRAFCAEKVRRERESKLRFF